MIEAQHPPLTRIAKLHGYADNIQGPKSIAVMALKLGAEQGLGLWEVKAALHGAISHEAWGYMWDAMMAIPVSCDYYQRMSDAADWLEQQEEV